MEFLTVERPYLSKSPADRRSIVMSDQHLTNASVFKFKTAYQGIAEDEKIYEIHLDPAKNPRFPEDSVLAIEDVANTTTKAVVALPYVTPTINRGNQHVGQFKIGCLGQITLNETIGDWLQLSSEQYKNLKPGISKYWQFSPHSHRIWVEVRVLNAHFGSHRGI
jgi:hypothetical protein